MSVDREAHPLRLSERHVKEINLALAAIFEASAYGEITLQVIKDRIDQIGVTWSVKFRGNGPDILTTGSTELAEQA